MGWTTINKHWDKSNRAKESNGTLYCQILFVRLSRNYFSIKTCGYPTFSGEAKTAKIYEDVAGVVGPTDAIPNFFEKKILP